MNNIIIELTEEEVRSLEILFHSLTEICCGHHECKDCCLNITQPHCVYGYVREISMKIEKEKNK